MSTYDETRQRVDEAVETLSAGLARLADPRTRLDFTESVLNEFLPVDSEE